MKHALELSTEELEKITEALLFVRAISGRSEKRAFYNDPPAEGIENLVANICDQAGVSIIDGDIEGLYIEDYREELDDARREELLDEIEGYLTREEFEELSDHQAEYTVDELEDYMQEIATR